jgi:predicted RNase H-like HicB family nuclease
MICNYTAKYMRLSTGYMGQLVDWPEIITEAKTIEQCRELLKDALHEMILAYQLKGFDVPTGGALFEQVPVEI